MLYNEEMYHLSNQFNDKFYVKSVRFVFQEPKVH